MELTILSPHRDDAVFSLCLWLLRWREEPLRVRVVNFFSVSEYAPHACAHGQSAISSLRKREDQRTLFAIDPRIRIESFDLLDAPLRFGIGTDAICRPETDALRTESEIDLLASQVRKYFQRSLVLAPLALGDHVDHRAVWKAALASCDAGRLAFYEDLPYSIWTPEKLLRDRVLQTERIANVKLEPAVIHKCGNVFARKFRLVSRYQSQITRKEAAGIARYACKYGGERIWIPRYGAPWRLLFSQSGHHGH